MECKNISMRNDQFYIIYEIDDADSVYGFNQWYLQQDKARPHIKKDILDAMASLKIQILPGWPPYMGNYEKKDRSTKASIN